jgi:glycyl-tRNA synthetase
MKKALNFQELILKLHQFWSERGCLIWQPYSEKVGAGTMNPATVLSVLGPEPWNVAYAEPSYRPDDGRFGENPNRMQMHTQYQVILKPDPGNPQEIYLDSLRAIGVDVDQHDIRFVEDNWESPALGAWGLGWDVWLDGLEITQFTYFQQAASHVLDIPAVEITYGLERIAIFLQGVRQVWDLQWNDQLTYGDVLKQPEIDHCHYDFEVADVDRLLTLYALFEKEANTCIDAGLVMPAHDAVLRCSHTFNVLDSRGAIGVTERAGYFGKMRDLSRRVADNLLAQREKLGHPLLSRMPERVEVVVPPIDGELTESADFLLEIGVEELPGDDLLLAIDQLRTALGNQLRESRLEFDSLWVSGTPRRVVAEVKGLTDRQSDRVIEVKGPPANKAFDADGKPTMVALGFCRSQGIDPNDLVTKTDAKGSYIVVTKNEAGQSATAVLAETLPKLLGSIKFRRSMRWDRSALAFSRPVRWIVCLHGAQVVPFRFGDLLSGRISRGPRPSNSEPFALNSASDYRVKLASLHVIVDRDERRLEVQRQITVAAAEAGGFVENDDALLDEVTDLVECPVAVLGRFEEERLTLPAPVLTTVMKKHQRYFPVVGGNGLLPNFVAVSNGQRGDMSLVRQGNEDVLRARYADAQYFVREDSQTPFEDFRSRLGTLTFQEKLGSMLEKSVRVEKLVGLLGKHFGCSSEEITWAKRAAYLCKADLATSMVVEMTSLQGVLGEIYAVQSGEPPAVGKAIREHYLPRYAGDATPASRPGLLVGVADRLDSLAGFFSVGLKPTGSADPYGLRRLAVGLVAMLVESQHRFDLAEGLQMAMSLYPSARGKSEDALAFIGDRLSVWLRETGLQHDVVEAVVAVRSSDPYGAKIAASALQADIATAGWTPLLQAYARCKRIVKDEETYPLEPKHYSEESTKLLYELLVKGEPAAEAEDFLVDMRELTPAIEAFFSEVLVNAEDAKVRKARVALVQRVARLPERVADLSKLEGF